MQGQAHSSTWALTKCHSPSHATAETRRASLAPHDVPVEIFDLARWQKWLMNVVFAMSTLCPLCAQSPTNWFAATNDVKRQLLPSPASAFGQEPIRRLLKRARYCSRLVAQSWRGTNKKN